MRNSQAYLFVDLQWTWKENHRLKRLLKKAYVAQKLRIISRPPYSTTGERFDAIRTENLKDLDIYEAWNNALE